MATHLKLPNALIDQMFADPDDNPETEAARFENVPQESRDQARDQQVAQQQAASEGKIHELLARLRAIEGLLREEVRTLEPLQQGDLVALLTDVGKVKRPTAAAILGIPYGRAGTYKWRAINAHQCGLLGQCDGIAGCAHERGAALLRDLIGRVLAKLT